MIEPYLGRPTTPQSDGIIFDPSSHERFNEPSLTPEKRITKLTRTLERWTMFEPRRVDEKGCGHGHFYVKHLDVWNPEKLIQRAQEIQLQISNEPNPAVHNELIRELEQIIAFYKNGEIQFYEYCELLKQKYSTTDLDILISGFQAEYCVGRILDELGFSVYYPETLEDTKGKIDWFVERKDTNSTLLYALQVKYMRMPPGFMSEKPIFILNGQGDKVIEFFHAEPNGYLKRFQDTVLGRFNKGEITLQEARLQAEHITRITEAILDNLLTMRSYCSRMNSHDAIPIYIIIPSKQITTRKPGVSVFGGELSTLNMGYPAIAENGDTSRIINDFLRELERSG